MVMKNFLSKTRTIDIQSCLPDAVILIKHDGLIQWANPLAEEVFGKRSLINSSIDKYLEGGANAVVAAVATKKMTIAKLNEKNRYIEISAKEIEDGYVVSMRDVTQKYNKVNTIIEGHENTKKVNYDKNAFLIKLSNDLKSPLHSIIGFSQALVDGLGGEVTEKQDKYLKIINKNSGDLLYLFNKLIELSQTESNSFDKDVKTFDIMNTVSTTIKINEQLYSEKQIEINLEIAEETNKTIYSDEKALKAILQTILDTIIRSTDIGTININMSCADEELLLSHNVEYKTANLITISSSSNSILESEIVTLFDPYAVIDKANKRSIVRAISLASTKNLMSYLNGIIWVESVPLKGTVFNLIIPSTKDINE